MEMWFSLATPERANLRVLSLLSLHARSPHCPLETPYGSPQHDKGLEGVGAEPSYILLQRHRDMIVLVTGHGLHWKEESIGEPPAVVNRPVSSPLSVLPRGYTQSAGVDSGCCESDP